jgi:DNA-binding NarL/FixJ family response regulator
LPFARTATILERMSATANPTSESQPHAPIRVLVVDDHPLFRDGLAALLSTQPDLELVAEAGNGTEAIERYRAVRPDVTLMDLSMPVMGGVEAIRRIVAEFPDARIVALTTYQGDADIHRALAAGARAYLLKDSLRHEVGEAIRTLARGGRVLPDRVARTLAEHTPRTDLTPRELEVLELLARGLQNSEIAAKLFRTEATVKVHVHHILAKLGVGDRTEAVVVALQRGIIHLG